MNARVTTAAILVAILGTAAECRSCTTFVLQDGDTLLFARNLDWFWSDGFMVVNQKGIRKTAFVLPFEKPARWTSKYGSVTFNQFSREMPFGGMNEAGLVIEQMMLFATQYPKPDDRPAVNMLQWIQYQLDNCRSVEEVIATDKTLRLELPFGKERIHYLVCDATGDTATIEFLDGKMLAHRGKRLPVRALTNDTYQKSAEFMKPFAGLGGADPPPAGKGSLHRFARAAKCSADFESQSPAADRAYAFHHLRDVAQGKFTVWSIVYDIPNRKIYYRNRDHDRIRWFALADFDYSPDAAPVFLDINAPGEGNVAKDFERLSDKLHQSYLQGFFAKQEVREKLGDLRPLAFAIGLALKSYTPAVRAEASKANAE